MSGVLMNERDATIMRQLNECLVGARAALKSALAIGRFRLTLHLHPETVGGSKDSSKPHYGTTMSVDSPGEFGEVDVPIQAPKSKVRFDLTQEGMLDEAVAMAEASTPDLHWGSAIVERGEMDKLLAETSESRDCWSAHRPDGDGSLFAAFTGNGPTSEANARFFAHSRDVVLALAEEVKRLRASERRLKDRLWKLDVDVDDGEEHF